MTVAENDFTKILINESGGTSDEAGRKWCLGNTEGSTNFLCCLNAFLGYGINSRKGAFRDMLVS